MQGGVGGIHKRAAPYSQDGGGCTSSVVDGGAVNLTSYSCISNVSGLPREPIWCLEFSCVSCGAVERFILEEDPYDLTYEIIVECPSCEGIWTTSLEKVKGDTPWKIRATARDRDPRVDLRPSRVELLMGDGA